MTEVLLTLASESKISRQDINIAGKGWLPTVNLKLIWEYNFSLLVVFFPLIPALSTKMDNECIFLLDKQVGKSQGGKKSTESLLLP